MSLIIQALLSYNLSSGGDSLLSSVRILFHTELVPLLPRGKRFSEILYSFRDAPSIKDAIEACGIPHTEVDSILLSGCSVSFDHRLQDGDRFSVYPFGFSPEIDPLNHLCPPLSGEATFILDVHLGKLARRLRILGFDCQYSNDRDDPEIIRIALDEQRIIITRDRGILKQSKVRHGMLIRSDQPNIQVLEVLQRYRLAGQIRPFLRCPCCNGLLQPIEKGAVRHRLLPRTALYYNEFHQCRNCRKLYWQGAHFRRISRWIDEMKQLSRGQDARMR